ncbi:MAG: 16S rRNA (guanine(966)-N(2))-methyltransferase RsmD [Betaproteobacteria bacterium]|nr:16S rRNA (guanine(966)-N(2))-methyltransferase RsmD [Betaproteobacteria bacterium]
MGRLRIIGGAWRKSVLHFPGLADLRPTPDRVRETLFNWLGQDLSGTSCLDLFAGSGALGLEAASRGAARVVLVERDRAAVLALRANVARLAAKAAKLPANAMQVIGGDASAFVSAASERFDVVFLDPPFRQNVLAQVLERLPRVLKSGSRVYVEALQPLQVAGAWCEMKRSRAGQVSYQLLEWNDDRSSLSGDV